MSSNGAFARRQLAILLVMAIPACKRELATEPDGVLRVEAVSPTDLKATVGEQVHPVPSVVVKSETGRAVPGIRVVFIPVNRSISNVADSLTNPIVTTDSHGIASPGSWTVGTGVGPHDLEARLVGEHSSDPDSSWIVTFHAVATAAAPVALSLRFFYPDTVALPGDELEPANFRALDRFGNDVSGVAITFSVVNGGGSLAKTQDTSSRSGSASPGKWTLGPRPGLNSLVASSPGLNSVTFNARALDAGAATWYDIVPQSVRLIVKGSIALCEDGIFELVTVEASDAFPGEWFQRQFGTYTLTGTVLVLRFATGVTESGTLVDNSLSFLHNKPNWGEAPQDWRFVKRPRLASYFLITGSMGPQSQRLRVAGDAEDVEVTVNGTRIPLSSGEFYSGNLPEAVPAGGKLTLKVVGGGRTFEASGIVEIPVIVAPVAGSTFASTDPIRLEWRIPTDPDQFDVCINCFDFSNDTETRTTTGGEREFIIRPGALADWGNGTLVAVYARTRNFLKPASSADGRSDVWFTARSPDIRVFIKQ